jgi:hypothetical protein
MKTVCKEEKPLEIKLKKSYVTFRDFSKIERDIKDALINRNAVVIDLTQATDGAQGDFYGGLLAKVQNFYATEREALDCLRNNLLLRFESRSSKAYEKLMQGYDFFFKVDFLNE